MTCPRECYQGVGQPTPNGTLTGIPKITDTKKPNRINQLGYIDGGETGIRTLGGIAATIDFESIPFGHSGISPRPLILTQP